MIAEQFSISILRKKLALAGLTTESKLLSQNEWKEAKQYFKDCLDSNKLRRSRSIEREEHSVVQTVDGKMVALLRTKGVSEEEPLGTHLGHGSGSIIKIGQDEQGKWVAVKIISTQIYGAQKRNHWLQETRVLKKLGQLLGVLERVNTVDGNKSHADNHKMYIIMQLYDGHDLWETTAINQDELQLLKNTNDPEFKKRLNLFFDANKEISDSVIQHIVYLHKKGLLHRDIKPENIMWTTSGKGHMMDFDLSQFGEKTRKNHLQVIDNNCVGTPEYMPPQMFNSLSHDRLLKVKNYHTNNPRLSLIKDRVMPGIHALLKKATFLIFPTIVYNLQSEAYMFGHTLHEVWSYFINEYDNLTPDRQIQLESIFAVIEKLLEFDAEKRASIEAIKDEFMSIGAKPDWITEMRRDFCAAFSCHSTGVVVPDVHVKNKFFEDHLPKQPSTLQPSSSQLGLSIL